MAQHRPAKQGRWSWCEYADLLAQGEYTMTVQANGNQFTQTARVLAVKVE